jgi:hypothetical protein
VGSQKLLRAVGVLGLVGVTGVLALDGVPDDLVYLLVAAIVAVSAPDVLEELPLGPWSD